ncbi:MAG: glycosyl transferase [Methylococcaceae bacterium]|nr:glycosyl transferase [Methylococcaceae bacterium]
MALFFLLAFLLSCLFTFFIRQYALHKSLLDIPNHRSSHAVATPRGGGLSVVIVFLIFMIALQLFDLIQLAANQLNSIILASLLVAGIGFWDDHQHIAARWRFSVHLLAILIVLLLLPKLPSIPLLGFSLNLSFFGFIFYSVSLVWLLNLYNFMDGIDGIASLETISVSLGAALLLFIQGDHNWSVLLVLLAVTVAGFMVWNWPHAKIFMGDACSGFLGLILGIFALMTTLGGLINLWSWLILLAVFITDASFTLITRFLGGERWYEAHCSHAYQNYARQLSQQFETQALDSTKARTKAHKQIDLSLVIINIFWLLPLAAIASFYPFWGLFISIIAFAPLVFIAKQLKAGQAE